MKERVHSEQILKLKAEIAELQKVISRSEERRKDIARANAHAAEMYVELEEKTEEIKAMHEQMESEMHAAREVQIAFMKSKLPAWQELEIAAGSVSASIINGDFYLIHPIDELNAAILIADCVGHGVPAALMSILARSLFISICFDSARMGKTLTAGGILSALNKQLKANLFEGGYLTAFLIIYNRELNQIQYSGAGHPKAVLWSSREKRLIYLNAENPILGVVEEKVFTNTILYPDQGDRIFLYTDGIIEAKDKTNIFFELKNLIRIIKDGCPGKSLEAIKEEIFRAVTSFEGKAGQTDDRTFVALEIQKGNKNDE